MAEWKTQLGYNYHHHHHAAAAGGLYTPYRHGYGAFMYHQPPEQNTGAAAAAPWADPGLVAAELANYHPGIMSPYASRYNIPPAAVAVTGTRGPAAAAASPPESPTEATPAAHIVVNGHPYHHYPGSQQGIIQYFSSSNPQTGHHVYLPQAQNHRDPYEKAWAIATEAIGGDSTARPPTPPSDAESLHASSDSLSPRCSSRDGGLPQADPQAWPSVSPLPDDPKPTPEESDLQSYGCHARERGLTQADPQTWPRQYPDYGGRDSPASPLPDDPKPTPETDSWSYGGHVKERALPYADPVAWTIRELDARRDCVSPDDPKPTLDADLWISGSTSTERGLPQTDPVAARDTASPDNPEPTNNTDSWNSGSNPSERRLSQTDPVAWTIKDLDDARDSVGPGDPKPTQHNTDPWSFGSNPSERGLPPNPLDWTRKDLDVWRERLGPDASNQVPTFLFAEKPNILAAMGEMAMDGAPDPIHAPLSTPKKRSNKRAKAKAKANAGGRARPNNKARSAFSESQMDTLMKRFNAQRYLTPAEMNELGEVTGLSYKQVKTWFQNRRMKLRRHLKDGEWDKNVAAKNTTSPAASPDPEPDPNSIQTYQEEVFRAQLQEQYNLQMVSAYNQSPGQNLAYYQYLAAMGGYGSWPTAPSSQPTASPKSFPTGWSTLNQPPTQTTHYQYSAATAGNSSGNSSIDSDDVVDLSGHGGGSQ